MHTHSEHADSGQANMVHDVEVLVGQRLRRACYYIENGVIVASIGNKTYRCPIGTIPAHETVQALVAEVARSKLD